MQYLQLSSPVDDITHPEDHTSLEGEPADYERALESTMRGKRIAYSNEASDDNLEIFVKNLTDGTTKRLTNSAGSDLQPSWSPDGSKIAFASRRTGQYQIWTMPASGGSPTRITHTTTMEISPAWSH